MARSRPGDPQGDGGEATAGEACFKPDGASLTSIARQRDSGLGSDSAHSVSKSLPLALGTNLHPPHQVNAESECGKVVGNCFGGIVCRYVEPSESRIFESLEETFVLEDAVEAGDDSCRICLAELGIFENIGL